MNYGFNNNDGEVISNHIFYEKLCARLKELLIDEVVLDEEDGVLIVIRKLSALLFEQEFEIKKLQNELSSLKEDVDEHLVKWIEELQND
jgi:hypothetical protein